MPDLLLDPENPRLSQPNVGQREAFSGIIHQGGVIGGLAQKGDWKIDVCFNKGDLIKRIRQVGRYRNRIRIYQTDALEFTRKELPTIRHPFAFFDPPYIDKGAEVYLNEYTLGDHRELSRAVVKLTTPWIVTYDPVAIRHKLYEDTRRIVYDLSYSARTNHRGREVMFLADALEVPRLKEFLGCRIIPHPQMSRLKRRTETATERTKRRQKQNERITSCSRKPRKSVAGA